MTVSMTARPTVMEGASIDSGLRRNDGWGSRNYGWESQYDGECDRTPWIPACAGMTAHMTTPPRFRLAPE